MLFDLSSSRRRRRTVKVIYSILALLIAGGLVLLGVGVGNGNGGLLNAFSNNGSGGNSAQNSLVTTQLKKAEARAAANPSSSAAWSNLVLARWQAANSGTAYNTTTGVYSAAGKTQLKQLLTAWGKYTSLIKGKPDESTTLLAARAYSRTGDFKGATVAWQDFIAATSGQITGYQCLSLTAYAAKNSNLGDQAAAKAVSLTPKLNQLTVKQTFTEAKASQTVAKEAALSEC